MDSIVDFVSTLQSSGFAPTGVKMSRVKTSWSCWYTPGKSSEFYGLQSPLTEADDPVLPGGKQTAHLLPFLFESPEPA